MPNNYFNQNRALMPKINGLALSPINNQILAIYSSIVDSNSRLIITPPRDREARIVWLALMGKPEPKDLNNEDRKLIEIFKRAIVKSNSDAIINDGGPCQHGSKKRYCAICRSDPYDYDYKIAIPKVDSETGKTRFIRISGTATGNTYRGPWK